MQTFLPYANFLKTAKCLDRKRLGKQRVEAKQILNALNGKSKGWVNHPAVKMWRGFEITLEVYKDVMIYEWTRRGYKNTMEYNLCLFEALKFSGDKVLHLFDYPGWFGREDFHSAHRAALLYKDYEYYKKFNWKEKPELNYKWR